MIVASDGSILFTDPTYGRMPGFGLEREVELDFRGVYRLPAGGGPLQLLIDDFAQPNGLCFSPDESLLYINDTVHAHIRVFDVGPDHALSNGRVFAEGIGTGDLATGELVDGMKLDEHGNVYVTGPKGVWIFAPDGEHLGVILVPGERRQRQLGRRRLEDALHPRLDLGVPDPAEGRREPSRLHALTILPNRRTETPPWMRSTRKRQPWSSRTCRTT